MRPRALPVVAMTLALLGASCGRSADGEPTTTTAPQPTGIVVTDALGRTVTLEAPPQRIAMAGKALFMVADAVYAFPEASSRIAAIGSTRQGTGDFIPLFDPAFGEKTLLDQDAGPEQIAAAQPDLVILKSTVAGTLGAPLEEIQIPVVYVDFETAEQYERDFATLGRIFQNEARAAEVTAFYRERLDLVTQALAGITDEDKPSTLVLYYSDKDGEIAFNVPPMTWMQAYLVETAGGSPVWADAGPGDGWTKVGLEQIAAWDPDQIYVVSYFVPVDTVVAGLQADPIWRELRAMQDGEVYGFAGDIYSWDQPDTRWILGLLWLAGKMHPDRFPTLDIEQEARTFYEQLYGMDAASFESSILPAFAGDLP